VYSNSFQNRYDDTDLIRGKLLEILQRCGKVVDLDTSSPLDNNGNDNSSSVETEFPSMGTVQKTLLPLIWDLGEKTTE
jgi:hypothetical protein